MPTLILSPGEKFRGKYKIIGKIGEGGMGVVYSAIYIPAGTKVAIKFCFEDDAESIARFNREVRVMQRMEKDPNVISILRTGITYSPPYFVMPLADGSLRDEIATLKGDEAAAIEAFLELCRGVDALHVGKVVHRDIKPGNALRLGGKIILSDLGLARFVDRDTPALTSSDRFLGTDDYAAPEQIARKSRDADHRADIYALGKVLYALCTAKRPLYLDYSALPAGLAQIVRRATRPALDDRYQSVGQLVDAIHVYRRTKSGADPIAVFESARSRIVDSLKRGSFKKSDLLELVAQFTVAAIHDDMDTFMELFDTIPNDALALAAQQVESDLEEVLERFVEVLDKRAGGRSFGYAEQVTEAMRAIFNAAASPTLCALAVEGALIAAVDLHRFAAIDDVNALLVKCREDRVAHEVAGILRRRIDRYRVIAGQVPRIKLHPAIRDVSDEAAKKK